MKLGHLHKCQPCRKRTHSFIVTSYTTLEHVLEHDEELLQVTCTLVEGTRAVSVLADEGIYRSEDTPSFAFVSYLLSIYLLNSSV